MNSGESGNVQTGTRALHSDVYVYDIRTSDLRNLCVILDEQDLWVKVATKMGYQKRDIDVSKRIVLQNFLLFRFPGLFLSALYHAVCLLFQYLNSIPRGN